MRGTPGSAAAGIGGWSALLAIGLAALLAPVAGFAQAPPDTDIWLATVDLRGRVPVMGMPMNVTARIGYDNQPYFLDDGTLVFTSQHGEQTDIYRMMAMDRVVAFTRTATSEYSATPVPGGDELSTIRVEEDGRQRLWAFPLSGADPRLLLADIEPVGYHAWLEDGTLALFVLGDPATLAIVNPGEGTARTVATDIGRSLHRIPGEATFSYLQRDGESWWVRAYDPAADTIADLGPALPGSQDMAWTPDGRILMATGSQIHARRPGDPDWRLIADLEGLVSSISRLAVSPEGDRIAIVGVAP